MLQSIGIINIMSGYSARKSSVASSQETVDKRITQIGLEISQSKAKIDDYINAVSSKVEQTINYKLTQYLNLHSSVIEEKDGQIRSLIQDLTRFKEIDRLEQQQQYKKALQECRESMQRMTSVLEFFRKESDKFRVELQIKEKQLDATRDRQKKLIKKIWILQENIKDIYSGQLQKIPQIQPSEQRQSRVKTHLEDNTHRYLVNASQQVKSQQNTSKTIYAQQISHRQRTQFKITIEQPPRTPKPTIYDKTNLNQQLNKLSSHTNGLNKLSNPRERYSVQRRPLLKQSGVQPKNSVYDDLRHSLRKTTRLDQECPKYLQEQQRVIGREQFRLIALNGPKIVRQIERIVIEQHGYLKEVDSESIALLNLLFCNNNAIKILEIVLFSYSIEALRGIKKNKEEIIRENFYSQPSVQSSEEPQAVKIPRLHKHKLDLAFRKNFKNALEAQRPRKQFIKVEDSN